VAPPKRPLLDHQEIGGLARAFLMDKEV